MPKQFIASNSVMKDGLWLGHGDRKYGCREIWASNFCKNLYTQHGWVENSDMVNGERYAGRFEVLKKYNWPDLKFKATTDWYSDTNLSFIEEMKQYYPSLESSISVVEEDFTGYTHPKIEIIGDASVLFAFFWIQLKARLELAKVKGESIEEQIENTSRTNEDFWYSSFDKQHALEGLQHLREGKEPGPVIGLLCHRGPISSYALILEDHILRPDLRRYISELTAMEKSNGNI